MDRNVKVSAIVEKMNLKNLTPEVDYSEKIVEVPDINRPALQLTGYFEHFDAERVQVIGYVEYTYLQKMSEEEKERIYVHAAYPIRLPWIVYLQKPECRMKMMLEKADGRQYSRCFQSEMKTSQFYGRADPLAECRAGSLYLYPWRAGGRIRRGRSDHG